MSVGVKLGGLGVRGCF